MQTRRGDCEGFEKEVCESVVGNKRLAVRMRTLTTVYCFTFKYDATHTCTDIPLSLPPKFETQEDVQ